MQAQLTREVNIKTEPHTSALGNHFYMNHPSQLFALVRRHFHNWTDRDFTTFPIQDFANPFVRPHIQLYPEIRTEISEAWQAGKWLNEIEHDDLGPMWADWKNAAHRHFFIKELAQLENNTFIIPIRWIRIAGNYYADAYRVTWCQMASGLKIKGVKNTDSVVQLLPQTGIFTIDMSTTHHILAAELCWNVKDLLQRYPVKFTGMCEWDLTVMHLGRG